jgi:stringent starvation protein B
MKSYLIRAVYDYVTDRGETPYIRVGVDESCRVPAAALPWEIGSNELVLNIGGLAVAGLELGDEVVTFKARFNGVSAECYIPVERVAGIWSRESGLGLSFDVTEASPTVEPERPKLKVVK